MKSIILARVSTAEQKEEGQSLPAQLKTAQDYRDRKGLEKWKEFQFDESSTKDHRKKFEEIIDLIKKTKERVALIVETIDRMQRSFKESVLLLDLIKADKVEVHFIRENLIIHKDSNSSEYMRWDIGVFMARSFVLQHSDNVKRTNRLKLERGQVLGHMILGYVVEQKENEPNGRIPDLERAHFIPKIYDLYLQGWSFAKIADEMHEQGLRSRNGKRVSKSKIRDTLKDPFYCGFITSKGKQYPHYYDQLIPPAVFQKVQDKMQERTNNTTQTRNKAFALSRLIRCKKCDCLISAEQKKERLVYYSCTNYKRICKREYIREEELMKPIQKLLKSLALPQNVLEEVVEGLKRTHEAKKVFHADALNGLRRQQDQKQNMLDKLIDLLAEGKIKDEDYTRKEKQYREELRKIEIRMQQYTDADEQYHITAKTVLSLAQRAHEIFESSEVHEKQQLLGYLLQNATLEGRKLDFTVRNPFNLIAKYSSRTNVCTRQDSNLQ